MITLNVKAAGANVRLALSGLPKQLTQSMKRAQRDTMQHLRAEIVRRTTAKYYVTPARLRRGMSTGDTELHITGPMLLLHNYKLQPTRPGKRKRTPRLRAAVKRGGGLKALGRNMFLFPTGGGSKYIVMEREGAQRFPIRPVPGPAIPQLVGNDDTLEGLEADVQEYYDKRLTYWAMQAVGAVR